ncbi:PilT/PilU family type 4a pilus ATPase [Alginatibacterium sediminis]|uniref:PilT/PilU family type 4a pilus ATPase n=1 Tax=Alginatibacterium sediminis TaxID=2164068 RepID=A0A420E8S2_9ALTE|nr:PilT/PilU family type 4a pilus ATPase [Alginatibacterium sediminis]RKF15664.1 PilT/PilU family type 4a pilus ATPase [Alginatibacterium sediminis]
MQTIESLLTEMSRLKASDLFLAVGIAPSIKLNGRLEMIGEERLKPEDLQVYLEEIRNPDQLADFVHEREANFAIARQGLGRFRVSAFFQREQPSMVIRRIETEIPSVDELQLPGILKELSMTKRGLILFVGSTGAGKSTTQASMIDYRNRNSTGHILTIEDPVEFMHRHIGCIVNQREVGLDTPSFDVALKNSLRQAPDVILIGEIRSRETMEFALQFAETGHLCMATLHANNANQALDRIMHLVPVDRHRQLCFDLSFNLRAIVAQQLIPSRDGEGRRGVFEILLNTPLAQDLIRKNEMHKLKELMKKSTEQGMLTFDQSLFELYQQGEVGYAEVLAHADSPNDLRLMIKLQGETRRGDLLDSSSLDGVTIEL